MTTETDLDRRLRRLEGAAGASANGVVKQVKLDPWQQEIADRQEDAVGVQVIPHLMSRAFK